LVSFNTANSGYQFLVACPAGYYLGVDALSIYFIVLTAAIFPVCILSTRGDIASPRFFFILLLLLEFFLLLAFLTTDLLFFYVAFEATLFPMLLIINIWGSRQRKKGAANYLFLYTLAGSFAMLFAIASIYLTAGTTDFV
jgi:NADH-quinone oxidoreductase subunit M